MTSTVRPRRFKLYEVVYLLSGVLVFVDIIAIIAKANNKQVTVVTIFNPLTWILAPVTAHGWIAIVIVAVVALLLYLLGRRLKKRPRRR